MPKLLNVLFACGITFASAAVHGIGVVDNPELMGRRGDANNDGEVDLSDAAYLNSYLFDGGLPPSCMNQADANDDGVVDALDSVHILDWQYRGGPAPPPPGPFSTSCTADPTQPFLGCEDPRCE